MAVRTLRFPLVARIGAATVLLLIGGLTVFIAWALFMMPDLRLILAISPVLPIFAVLLRTMWRETRYKFGWRAELAPGSLSLRLPSRRSLQARLDEFERTIPRAELAGLESRDEGYASLGLGMTNCTHALRLRDGSRIVLGETRGRGSSVEDDFIGVQTRTIAEAYGLPWRDLPPAIGQGGFLTIIGAQAPSEQAAASNAEWEAHLVRCERTNWIPAVFVPIAFALALLASLF